MLEKTSSRRALKRIQDDSASLHLLRDAASFSSQCNDSLSKLSVTFAFDRQLLGTKVYDRVFRKTLKRVIHEQQTTTNHRRDITTTLYRSKKLSKRNEIKVLLFGDREAEHALLTEMLKTLKQVSKEQHDHEHCIIKIGTMRLFARIFNTLSVPSIEIEPEAIEFGKGLCQKISEHDLRFWFDNGILDLKAACFLEKSLRNPLIQQICDDTWSQSDYEDVNR